MNENINQIFEENLEWIKRDKKRSALICEGVISEIGKKFHTLPSPEEAYSAFKSLGGNETKDFACLCKHLLEQNNVGHTKKVSPSPEYVSYMRSPVADKAFELFSHKFPRLKAVYGRDFKSICEDVYCERAECCILPLESSTDGLLMTFRHMLMKYELKIVSVVTVQTDEDSYQLMSLLTSGNTDNDENMSEYYLPSLTSPEFMSLTNILDYFGASLIRVSSVPSKYGNSYDHHICVDVPKSSSLPLQYCIDGLFPANILLGKYKI